MALAMNTPTAPSRMGSQSWTRETMGILRFKGFCQDKAGRESSPKTDMVGLLREILLTPRIPQPSPKDPKEG